MTKLNNISKFISNKMKTLYYSYNKSSVWCKLLIFTILLLFLIIVFKGFKSNLKEGFEQIDKFLVKSGAEIYDNFYADIYDYLVFNSLKDEYEIGEIINKTTPTNESIILDVGCGTGHHVASLETKGINVIGVDNSEAMIKKAKENYPNYNFQIGDVLNADSFTSKSFTHILCLYFTVYYFQDKKMFFENCYKWLKPGGYLIVHLVDRNQFDPILPPGNPLLLVSPQRYAKKRITTTKVKFNDFSYNADFQLDEENSVAKFVEKFRNDNDGKVRKNEHTLYMPPLQEITDLIQETGFIAEGMVDLIKCQYEYQYLYIFIKPN
jgi:SAM-dependent methyltransferase